MPRGSLQSFLGVLLIVEAALFCHVAAAEQTRRFDLAWLAPAGCPTGVAVTREIDELIASSAASTVNATIAANASIVSDPAGFTLTLTVRDAEGSHERRLDAPNCEELGHAAALIVALAIDPALLANHADPGGRSPNTAPPQPVPAPTPSPLSSTSPPPTPIIARAEPPATTFMPPSVSAHEPLFWRVGLSAFAGYHTLPGVNLGAGVFGAIQGKMLRLELAASAIPGEAKANAPRQGATFALYQLAPRVCWLVAKPTWAAGPCAGIELGRISGQGHGVDTETTRWGNWLASSFGALFEWRLAPSSLLGAFVDAEVPLMHDRFTLAGETLFRPQISARFGISLAAGWR